MRFLGLGLGDAIPDADTTRTLREALTKAGATLRLFELFDQEPRVACDLGHHILALAIFAPDGATMSEAGTGQGPAPSQSARRRSASDPPSRRSSAA